MSTINPQPSPAIRFNEFLTRAAKAGSIQVEHRRVRSRQPDNEIFVRKALVAMRRLTPKVTVKAGTDDLLPSSASHGRADLAMAATSHMNSISTLRPYVGEPLRGSFDTGHSLSAIELFTLLHAYAYGELSTGMGVATGFGMCAASAGMALAGQQGQLPTRVTDAADSLYSQSFCDVHAISLVAAFNGNRAALALLNEVTLRRDSAGDFAQFALAPLSQDTSSALEILRHQLVLGKDFNAMSRLALMGHSTWVASEGLGAWLEKHGASPRAAVGVAAAAETATQILRASSDSLQATARTSPAPFRPEV